MNFDELNNPAIDTDSDRSADPDIQENQYQRPSQEALNLPSAPLDPEWVSPFTLPPLPALRKNRGHSKLLRSPEERLLHQRSSSSAYYAAAWGSPYATPSPAKSPSQQRLRRRSQDLGTGSPLSSRAREFTPEGSSIAEISRPSSIDRSTRPGFRPRANSWDKSISLSERFNWLSESDLSGNEADIRAERTPTRDTYLKDLKASVDRVSIPRSRSHQVQESVATITPESFNESGDPVMSRNAEALDPPATMETVSGDISGNSLPNGAVDKPLPSLPSLETAEKKVDTPAAELGPDSPSRPRMPSLQSFQRPKKKIVWKGKTCIIALPLTDRESAGLPPLLTSEEVRQRMQKWAVAGYDIDALSTGGPQDTAAVFGQSRPLYPDPQEVYFERQSNKLHVHIPDLSEWDAWVDYLKEEKLRALGVTPSNSEAPMSTQSPFSSTLSRVSSTYPSLTASPPVGTLSAHGNPVRIANNTFSPPLGHQNGMRSHGGSHVPSPSISGYIPMHGYKQSIAQPRLTSPYDYPITHPGSFAAGMRNTPNGYGTRQFSPPTAAHLQSLGQALAPIVPTVPSNDGGRGVASNPTMEQIFQQQQRQQQLQRQLIQHNRQYSYFAPPQSKSADQLPRTPVTESPSRRTPEIMHPTPRSHRHNLSAALQRGVDDAEAALQERKSTSNSRDQQEAEQPLSQQHAEPIVDEDQEPELPVLKRPETLPDGDDKSEPETNPSIAASPLLTDDKNPFAIPFTNLQQIKQALQPQSQHKPTPSVSKLNVEAPVFDPTARFSSSSFSFGGQSFEPTLPATDKRLVSGSRPSYKPKNLSFSKLNVEAPSFTPSFVMHSTPSKASTPAKDTPAKQSIATPSKASFTFSSPILNVDAPEFKPSQSFSFNTSVQSFPQDEQSILTSAGSIFGNVTVDANSKVSRRGTKLVPIVRPKSSEGKEVEPADDEEGRITAPSDRQKRVRRFGDDDDEELLFASSAPFDHQRRSSDKEESVTNISDAKQTSASASIRQHSPSESHEVDIEPEIDAIEDEKDEAEPAFTETVTEAAVLDAVDNVSDVEKSLDPELAIKADSEIQDSSSQIEAHILDEPLVNIEDATSSSTLANEEQITAVRDNSTEDETHEDVNQLEQSESTSQNGHKSKFSLSALAKPFEFRPGAAAAFVPQQAAIAQPAQVKKAAGGLMASKFARSSPEPELSTEEQVKDTSLQDMYEYIKSEDTISTELPSTQELSQPDTPFPKSISTHFGGTSPFTQSIEESLRSDAHYRAKSRSPSQSSRVEEPMPSYEEIDAVMKQFENNPDLGVERDDTPVKSTPLIDMRLAPTFRSDAPSPSPRHVLRSPQRRGDWGLGIHRLNGGVDEVSDWNDEFSPRQEDKLQNQAQYFDGRVNNIVDGILGSRLGPLEETLQTIQRTLIGLTDKKARANTRRSVSVENKDESDADDEDDYDAFDGIAPYRSRSPSRNQRKADKIRAVVLDAMAAYKPAIPNHQQVDMSGLQAALEEVRKLSQNMQQQPQQEQPDFRAIMEDIISNHPQIKAITNREDVEAIKETHRIKLQAVESSLLEAQNNAEREAVQRKQVEDDVRRLNQRLVDLQDQSDKHREAEEKAQSSSTAYLKEIEAYHRLQSEQANLIENNKALEDTLAEYRVTSNQFREDIHDERSRNQELVRMMDALRDDFNGKLESRQALRSQMERLQDRMSQVMADVHADQAEWREKEHELVLQKKTIQAALDHEIKHREKIEIELDNLDKEHKENIRFRTQHEQSQKEVLRMQEQVAKAIDDSKAHQDKSFRLERDLTYAKEATTEEVSKAVLKVQSELDTTKAALESTKTDADAQISRLQKRLEDTELDLEAQKTKTDASITEAVDAHNRALREVNEKHEAALKELQSSHEQKLNDLRERHTRALHNSSDDRRRLEEQLKEKLALGDERIEHLQNQVKDLEESLQITKSAARAAVEAATARAANIPTPAPSVMASPPQRVSGASLQITRGSDLPEKISPQAMRESIMVLQDQLQNREQTIEALEAEIASFDKDAPAKIKERDNEISLLRELLAVRVDDLNEIITTLSQTDYDRIATKNAAIRLRANLQMEQQLKERAAVNGGLSSSLPSLATISSLAQSPRGLPMAAAAALGNWRKARDFSLNAVSDIASNISQTPSRSNAGSPSAFLAGIMTPPSTSQRTPSPSGSNPMSPPTMRPLAAAAAARKGNPGASEARPLRIHTSQARTLSSRQAEKRRQSNESSSSEMDKQPKLPHAHAQPETPTTPTISRNVKNLDLEEDLDGDASPFNASEHENFGSDAPYKEALEA